MSELHYDKNATTIIIPNGTKSIPDEYFIDNNKLEEIIIPDSVEYIGRGAFKGCKSLKKVQLPKSLKVLEQFAFSECESLEEINIPSSLHYYSYGVFSHCHNLKTINSHNEINYIDDLAFYNCKNLENFNIPSNASSIGRMAFMGCEKIKEITIPKKTDCIEIGAFGLMSSLEKISVEEGNKKYFTLDDNTVLVSEDGIIIQYAINSDNEEFIVGYYDVSYGNYTNEFGDVEPLESSSLIYNICDYAFAGAKKLKKIYFASEIQSIGGKTFMGCDNLKDLEIFHTSYGDSFLLNIFKAHNEDAEIPFENITVGDGIKTLCESLAELFKNAKNITLPESLEHIGKETFSKSKDLKHLNLPSNLKMINPNAFHPDIEITFPTFGTMKAKEFNMLQTKTNADYYLKTQNKGNVRIFSLTDGTYHVKIDDYDIVKVNKDEINKLSNSSSIMSNKPDDVIMYLIDLLSINANYHSIMNEIWMNPELKSTFDKFINDLDYVQEIATNKTSRAIREIFNNSGVYDELLFTGIMMRYLGKEDVIKVLENYNASIDRFFRLSPLKDNENVIIDTNRLIKYCSFLEKYKRYDKFFYNPIFFQKLSEENQELLVKHFNKNIKHLLKNSKTIHDSYGENLNDLLNLCNALGIFGEDKRISQQMTTFINEKMFDEQNENAIIGHDIHTIFGDIKPREEIDYEFIKFFIENYNELIELEKSKTGIITRIYNAFRDISKTSTSHRGEQRQLKVTIDKCLDYFLSERFEGVTEENKELAYLLQKYYSESYALQIGEKIIRQSKEAPRNIFSKIEYDKQGNKIYSQNPDEDLIDDKEYGFYYHWLPKQDYDNLVLGKYCSCCAHILSAGAGIMRASMILDNCQNLVIRNEKDEIIAKMTIYVNREQGYAVFNTAEINVNYRPFKDEICEAFLRGVNDFVITYNSNNIIPIKTVSIGEYRNIIKDDLGNRESELYDTPNYSDYGYYVGDTKIGTYNGDSKEKQILVLKK
ncbi:MAG: leucine-rich repeat domain-containing protein [Bacilli bacterium]|nr:leucine-rich repeat domain-containing protein [Bacilli bacterium]